MDRARSTRKSRLSEPEDKNLRSTTGPELQGSSDRLRMTRGLSVRLLGGEMGVSGRFGIFSVGVLAFMTLLPQKSEHDDLLSGVSSGKTRVLDLSYGISDKLVPWPGDKRWFESQVNATVEKNGYFTRSFWMLEHYGTHLDAPIHFPPGKTTVDQIPAKQFFGPAVVLDVSADAAKNADYQAPASRVEEWEKKHGRVAEGSIVLLKTGWRSRWPNAQKYRNQDAQGKMHFPG